MKKIDHRNVKQTQYDPGQVVKATFSELNSATRSVSTNAILKDAYTHFVQVVDGSGRPTQVDYYQATEMTQDTITFVADVGGNLNGTAIILTSPITNKQTTITIGVDFVILNNDPAPVIQMAFYDHIITLDDFIVSRTSPMSDSITVGYLDFGEADNIDLGTTGFSVSRVAGNEELVGEVEISYDGSGHPIYNGQTLTDHRYNVQKAEFELMPQITVTNPTPPFGTFDEIQTTYPSAEVEVYTYKLATVTIGTVTITYTDATKVDLVSAIYL